MKAFFIKILISKNNDCHIKHNIFFTIAFLSLLMGGDIFLTATGRTNVVFEPIIGFIIIISCFSLSFCKEIIKNIISTLAMIPIATNLIHIAYFGVPIDIDGIYKIFTETGDILECWKHIVFILPFIFIPYAIVIFLSHKYDKKCYHSTFLTLLLLYALSWIYICAKYPRNITTYGTPIPTRLTAINSFRTFPYFLINLSKKEDNDYPQETIKPYEIKLVNKNSSRVIFIIWGESTQADYLSLFGKSRFIDNLNDMPNMTKMINKNKNHYIFTKNLSNGCETMGSTTLFFNLLQEPTNVNFYAKGNRQNIFTLAKQNGYTTHWFSAAQTNIMTTGAMPADNAVTRNTHTTLPDGKRDDYLLEKIKKLDLSKGKHLVVVQFNSLHVGYAENYSRHKDKFEYFKVKNEDDKTTTMRKEYINNIFYLDYLLSEVFNFAQKNGAEQIFYTADHGEIIGTNYNGDKDAEIYGHNKLGFGDMIVPFILWQKYPNKKLFNEIKEKKIMTNYEVSKLVANALGYSVKNPNEQKDVFFMYSASYFRKDMQIKKVKRVNGWFQELYHGTMIDYFKKTYNFKPKEEVK